MGRKAHGERCPSGRGHRGGLQSNSEDRRETWKRRSDYSRAREAQRGALGAEDNKRGEKSKSSKGGGGR